MENKSTNMIIKIVKINKTIFMETYMKSGYNYLRNAIVIAKRTKMNLFVFIVIVRRT